MSQMLAAAEADLQPDRPSIPEKRGRIDGPALGDARNPQPWQQLGDEPALRRAKRLAMASPVEIAERLRAGLDRIGHG